MASAFVPANVTSNSISNADHAGFTPNPGLSGNHAQGFGGDPVNSDHIVQDREYATTKDDMPKEEEPKMLAGNPADHQLWSESPFVHYVKSNLSNGKLQSLPQPLDTVSMGIPTPKSWIRYDHYSMDKEADIFADVDAAENVEGNTTQQPIKNRQVYAKDESVTWKTTKKDFADPISLAVKKAPMSEIAGKVILKESVTDDALKIVEHVDAEAAETHEEETPIPTSEAENDEPPSKKIRQRYEG